MYNLSIYSFTSTSLSWLLSHSQTYRKGDGGTSSVDPSLGLAKSKMLIPLTFSIVPEEARSDEAKTRKNYQQLERRLFGFAEEARLLPWLEALLIVGA